MFRRLYWIVEQIGEDSSSRVTGVYTSIQDLVNKGLKWSENLVVNHVRITLMKPDTFDKALGSWKDSEFGSLRNDLEAYIQSHEYSEEEVDLLCQATSAFVTNATA